MWHTNIHSSKPSLFFAESEKFARSEAYHLMSDSDLNKDGVLTRAEVSEAYSTWLGSHATAHGELLTEESLARPAPHESIRDEL